MIPDPHTKFDSVTNALDGEFSLVTKLYNGHAEHPGWQARFFCIVAGVACFIDVIDARVGTKPPRIYIHNRDWLSGVPKAASQYILDVAKQSGVLFKLDEETK